LGDNFPLIGAILVNFNGGEMLLEAVNSLLNSSYPNLKIILVDNASHDGSAKAILVEYKDVILIENDKNLGFAVGNNIGIGRAIELGCEYIFFLNNDATVNADAISLLHQHLESVDKCVAVAPFIFYHHKPKLIWFGGGEVALWRGWIGHRHIRKEYKSNTYLPEKTDYLTGCTFLIRSEPLRKAMGFDQHFGLYSEDVDLSLRLIKKGYELWVYPNAHAFHQVSATAGGELSPFKAYYRGRSNALIVKRYARYWEWITLIVGGLIGGVTLSIKLLLQGKTATVIAIWHGIFSGLIGLSIPRKYRLKNSE
jgi:GT2 family glycosyltransferase